MLSKKLIALSLPEKQNKIKFLSMMNKLLKSIALLIFNRKPINKVKLWLNINIVCKSTDLELPKIQLNTFPINGRTLVIKVCLTMERAV